MLSLDEVKNFAANSTDHNDRWKFNITLPEWDITNVGLGIR